MTRYFYDTEFLEDGRTIELISIGILAEDGREYYAVNSDMPEDRLKREDWLAENVIAHLPINGAGYRGKNPYKSDNGHWIWSLDLNSPLVKPKWVIRNEVRAFMSVGGPPTELWADYGAYDHVVLAQLFGKMINLPSGWPMWTHDLQHLIQPLVERGYELPQQPGTAHNALDDARFVWGQWSWASAILAGNLG